MKWIDDFWNGKQDNDPTYGPFRQPRSATAKALRRVVKFCADHLVEMFGVAASIAAVVGAVAAFRN